MISESSDPSALTSGALRNDLATSDNISGESTGEDYSDATIGLSTSASPPKAIVSGKQNLPYRKRDHLGFDGSWAEQTAVDSKFLPRSASAHTAPHGLKHADAATRNLSPMSSEEFGGSVRQDFSGDPLYERSRAMAGFDRGIARWRQMQGAFHGRPIERRRNSDDDGELGVAAGPAEPRTPEGLGPGLGPRGEMLGDEWQGFGREPWLGPMDSAEAERYEQELKMPGRTRQD